MGKVYAWKIYMPGNSVRYCYMPTVLNEDSGEYEYAEGETPVVETPYGISPCAADLVRGITSPENYSKAFTAMLDAIDDDCIKNSLKNYTAYYNIGCD